MTTRVVVSKKYGHAITISIESGEISVSVDFGEFSRALSMAVLAPLTSHYADAIGNPLLLATGKQAAARLALVDEDAVSATMLQIIGEVISDMKMATVVAE